MVWPFTFFTWVCSVGFSNDLLLSFAAAEISFFCCPDLMALLTGMASSSFTSLGILSVLSPTKEGCLITPSLVISANRTSHTSDGLSQVAVALGGSGLNREGL